MNEFPQKGESFIGYEYRDVTVSQKMQPVYADGYASFGWTLESAAIPVHRVGAVTLKIKRDRKIRNKAELSRLQRQFEGCTEAIESLENSKIIGASAVAYLTGIAGTVAMAGSVFAYLDRMIVISIILAVPAFAGWIAPYFCYQTISKRKSSRVNPIIEQKYDEIYEVCKKALSLFCLSC
jgi:hypothetical protein